MTLTREQIEAIRLETRKTSGGPFYDAIDALCALALRGLEPLRIEDLNAADLLENLRELQAEFNRVGAENERLREALKRASTRLAWVKANWEEPGIRSMRRVDEGIADAAAALERKPE